MQELEPGDKVQLAAGHYDGILRKEQEVDSGAVPFLLCLEGPFDYFFISPPACVSLLPSLRLRARDFDVESFYLRFSVILL